MRNTTVTSIFLLSAITGCSLIKVNGKPLGGGNDTTTATSSASSSESSSESPSSSPADDTIQEGDNPYVKCGGMVGPPYKACMKRYKDAADKRHDAKMATQPTWCKEVNLAANTDVELDTFKNITDPKRDMYRDAVAFAKVMCSVDGANLEQRPKVMEIRTAWMKHHTLDEKDFLAAVAVETRYVPDDQKLTALGPAVAQLDLHKAEQFDQLGTRISMLGRIGFVDQCRHRESSPAISKILCAREPLDLAKAFAEIDAAPGILPHMRLRLRRLALSTIAAQRKLNAELAALAKEEPAVNKLIAIADAQHKEWANPTPARAKLIALVEQMEHATASNKRSAFTGCDAPAHAAWAEVVRAREIPSVSTKNTDDTMRLAVFTTAESYLAYRALNLCVAGLSTYGNDSTKFSSSVVRRGPRTSTVAAWFAASAEIKFDSRDLDIGSVLGNGGREERSYDGNLKSGTIAKLTKNGSKVTVEFQKVIEQYEDCIASVPTKQIGGFDTAGRLYYLEKCTKYGMVKADRTRDSIELDAVLAQGLKPGMRMVGNNVATANAKSSKAVWLFGVSLE